MSAAAHLAATFQRNCEISETVNDASGALFARLNRENGGLRWRLSCDGWRRLEIVDESTLVDIRSDPRYLEKFTVRREVRLPVIRYSSKRERMPEREVTRRKELMKKKKERGRERETEELQPRQRLRWRIDVSEGDIETKEGVRDGGGGG